MLQRDYFEGITEENIEKVHSYLMSLKIAEFSLATFRTGECTDVDYKKDFKCEDIDALTLKLELLTIPKKKKGEGVVRKARKDNKGVWWSDRRNTSITSAPYVKVYSKEVDLKYKSTTFADSYLIGQEVDDLARVEFTIKNKKHFRNYNVNSTALLVVTAIPQSILEEMLQISMSKHIERATRAREEEEGVTPKEQEMINLIHLLQVNRVGLNEAKRGLFGNLKRKTRERREKTFEEIWIKHFSKFSRSEQVTQVENWLNEVGVQFL
jgi:hypothetical protein